MISRFLRMLWLPILLALVAGTTALFFCVPVKIESSFFSLLPLSQNSALKREAIEKISQNSASAIHVLFVPANAEALDFAIEKQKIFAAELAGTPFQLGELAAPPSETLQKIAEIFRPFRFQLLAPSHQKLLEENQQSALAEAALAELHSPISARLLSVREDPFGFLTAFFLENPLLKSPFKFIDSVPVAPLADGRFCAYLPLKLETNDSLRELISQVEFLENLRQKLSDGNVKIELAGVPVHTARSASRSLAEINWLSIASLAVLFALFFAVFRSLKAFFVGAGTLGLAGTLAFAATNAIFGQIHTLALLFGCSLLGIAVDYILHLVIAGTLTRPLARALILSAGTTCLAFVIFVFAGVELLQQIAIFTIIGVAAALILVLGVLARFEFLRSAFPRQNSLFFAQKFAQFFKNLGARAGTRIAVFAAIFGGFFVALAFCDFTENLKKLYSPDDDLKRAEAHYAQLTGFHSAQNFLISAGTQADLLEQLADFEARILVEIPDARVTNLSQIVPAISAQKRNFELALAMMKNPPATFPIRAKNLPTEFEPLLPEKIFEPENAKNSEAESRGNALGGETSSSPIAVLNMLFGRADDQFYAIVIVNNAPRERLSTIVAGTPFATSLDFLTETNDFLEKTRNQSAIFLAIALAGTLILFSLRYGIRRGWRLILPSLAALAGTVILLVLCGFSLTLFHLLALFLILGFGVDYVIHAAENSVPTNPVPEKISIPASTRKEAKFLTSPIENLPKTNSKSGEVKNFASLANPVPASSHLSILLSCATTFIAFGFLAFTAFPLTREIGLLVAAGIVLSYIFSNFAKLN